MIGLDFGNYNAILSQLKGNEMITLTDSTGLRQIPTFIRYGDHRVFRQRSGKAERDFLHNLETANAVDDQKRQLNNIFAMLSMIKTDMKLPNKIVAAFPSHKNYYIRCLYNTVLHAAFPDFTQLIPAHLCVVAQYFFRRFDQFQMRPQRFGFLQVNEFDTVYCEFNIHKSLITTTEYKVINIGSYNFDQLIFEMCREKYPQLSASDFYRLQQEVKKVKQPLSLHQNGVITFPEFDIPISYASFKEKFEKYQSQIMGLVNTRLDAFELLGGGSRLLELPEHLRQLQTKRLNPDEVLAQGAVVAYLLSAQKKIQFQDQYWAPDQVSLNKILVLKSGVRVPCASDISLQLQKGQKLSLQLGNNFIVQEFSVEQAKYFHVNVTVKIDEFYNITIGSATTSLNEQFSFLQDQNIIKPLLQHENERRRIDEETMQQILLQDNVASQTSEVDEFTRDFQAGKYQAYITPSELQELTAKLSLPPEQREQYFMTGLPQQVKQRYYYCENFQSILNDLKNTAEQYKIQYPYKKRQLDQVIQQIENEAMATAHTNEAPLNMLKILDRAKLDDVVRR